MKLSGGASSEERNKRIAIAAFVVVAAAVVYFEYFAAGGASTPTPAPVAVSAPASPATTAGGSTAGTAAARPVAGRVAKTVGTTGAKLDPTLHMGAMLVSESVLYAGTGRNIFSAQSAPPPVAIPKPVVSARIAPVVVQAGPPPPPPGPPPPPPINLKFFGVETSGNGTRLAFLLHDDDVLTATVGDVVMRRYKVVSIEAKTIHVEDMQFNNTQTLPLEN
jgi:hypothetical protein